MTIVKNVIVWRIMRVALLRTMGYECGKRVFDDELRPI